MSKKCVGSFFSDISVVNKWDEAWNPHRFVSRGPFDSVMNLPASLQDAITRAGLPDTGVSG